MTLLEFKTKWLGGRIDFDHGFGYQCVDLARQYVEDVWELTSYSFQPVGGAIDAYNDFGRSLVQSSSVEKIENDHSNVNQLPDDGDILVFAGHPGNIYGHIVIVTSAFPSGFTALEQNGGHMSGSGHGADAVRETLFNWINVLGWLHKNDAVEPVEPPQNPEVPTTPETPPTPPVEVSSYQEWPLKSGDTLGEIYVEKYGQNIKWGHDADGSYSDKRFQSYMDFVVNNNPGIVNGILPPSGTLKIPLSL